MWLILLTASMLLSASAATAGILSFTTFHDPSQVDAGLNSLEAAYPSRARIETIGTSLGGVKIRALKISDNPSLNEPSEGDVVFVAEHHAREWISVEMVLYLADELLARYATDATLRADMDQLQIWIVPLVNPDGFAYTWTPSGDRYWRKNRLPNGDGSFGVDLNRNWGYQWGLPSGSSGSPWEETYRGTAAFSELETQAIRDFLAGRTNLKGFVTYHSYSELYLRPWSYTTGDPPGEPTLRALVQRAIGRIAAVHGHTYAEEIWYTSSGEATDYVWNQWRIAAFTPELRPACPSHDRGCFAPPASEILPNNEENLPAAIALIHDAARTGIWVADHPADTGAEPSAVWTDTGWSRPFWESPDVWTTPPGPLVEGSTVTMNVRVRNNTGAALSNVTVDVAYTDPRIALEFPNPTMTLIGTRTVSVPAAGTTISLPWTVPTGTNSWGERHWCVGVVVRHDDDMPLTTQVQKSSNIACRNFETTAMLAGQQAQMLMLAAENYLAVPTELVVDVDASALPSGWRAILGRFAEDSLRHPRPGLCGTDRKARLLGARGLVLEPGERRFLPLRIIAPGQDAGPKEFDVRVSAALLPLVAGKREPIGNGFTYHVRRP